MMSTGEEGIRRGKINVKVIAIKMAIKRKINFLYMNTAKGLLKLLMMSFMPITIMNVLLF